MVISALSHLKKIVEGQTFPYMHLLNHCLLHNLILTFRLKAKGEDTTQGKWREKAFIVIIFCKYHVKINLVF